MDLGSVKLQTGFMFHGPIASETCTKESSPSLSPRKSLEIMKHSVLEWYASGWGCYNKLMSWHRLLNGRERIQSSFRERERESEQRLCSSREGEDRRSCESGTRLVIPFRRWLSDLTEETASELFDLYLVYCCIDPLLLCDLVISNWTLIVKQLRDSDSLPGE